MGKFSNVAHYQDFTELKKILSASAANTYDMDKIEKAYKFAEKAHGDQRRVSGIPYILHPVSVACIVAELGMDTDSVCGALLHDTVEDTGVTLEEVTKLFGADVVDSDKEYSAQECGIITNITKNTFDITTGAGVLRVNEVQLEGKKRMDAASFLRGCRLTEGTALKNSR